MTIKVYSDKSGEVKAQEISAERVSQHDLAAQSAAIAARYPVATGAVTAEQQARQDAENACTLAAVVRERTARQFVNG